MTTLPHSAIGAQYVYRNPKFYCKYFGRCRGQIGGNVDWWNDLDERKSWLIVSSK